VISSIKTIPLPWLVLGIAALLYVALVVLLYLTQSRYVYYPESKLEAYPSDVGLAFEEVNLVTEDGIRLSAWYVPSQRSQEVILFCHGNAGNISHRLDSLGVFYNLGFSTFIFDYRGYGRSEGHPSEQGTYKDAEAAWQYLVKVLKVPPNRIVIFGRSLGGAIATELAVRHQPAALIIESTFMSFKDIASEMYPYIPTSLIARFSYNTLEHIRNVKAPVLIVHSSQDDIIPFRHGQSLYSAAREPKEFLKIQGDHNTGFLTSGEEYIKGLDTFVNRFVRQRNADHFL